MIVISTSLEKIVGIFGILFQAFTEKNQGEIFKVLGKEQREAMTLEQARESAATEATEQAAFIFALKGSDLLKKMLGVWPDKEEIVLKMPQAKETQTGFKTEFLGILEEFYR